MRKSLLVPLAMIAAVGLVLVGFFVFANPGANQPGPSHSSAPSSSVSLGAEAENLVREDSAVLSAGTEAVLVEFLDFECEACIALHPVVEDLRERYGDRVSFVVRHMPLHGSSLSAALAAEAAAQQGQFEAMYQRLFANPEEWGHQSTPQTETFFRYATELGLDMEQFRTDYESSEVFDRVSQSVSDGQSLGVDRTPTFFLNGERLNLQSIGDLEASIEAALAN